MCSAEINSAGLKNQYFRYCDLKCYEHGFDARVRIISNQSFGDCLKRLLSRQTMTKSSLTMFPYSLRCLSLFILTTARRVCFLSSDIISSSSATTCGY